MKLLNYFIASYLIGYLVFLTGNFAFDINTKWDNAYFIWSSICHGGFLAWASIYFLCPPVLKKYVWPVCIFAASLSVWEVISLISGVSINNQIAVMVQFFVLIGVIGFFSFKGFRNIHKYLNHE